MQSSLYLRKLIKKVDSYQEFNTNLTLCVNLEKEVQEESGSFSTVVEEPKGLKTVFHVGIDITSRFIHEHHLITAGNQCQVFVGIGDGIGRVKQIVNTYRKFK